MRPGQQPQSVQPGSNESTMRYQKMAVLGLVLTCIAFPTFARDAYIHHSLTVSLDPATGRIAAKDAITLPDGSPREASFTLHSGMKPACATSGVRIIRQGTVQAAVPLEKYTAFLPAKARTFTLSYEGSIDHPLERRGGPQAQGIDETPGLISSEGVFLSGSSGWYADFETDFVTFDLEIKLPAAWDAVSQGERTKRDRKENATLVRWKSPEPQEEIYLVAARFTEYSRTADLAQAMVYLRTPDQGLADRYLDATAGYLALYSRLIGPYPYRKFALVENFWESGFGMPSFTLLGSRIIRLPFIINSSYPHEILHNWWGNSVFPDFAKGNWSEGLTAYLADHLVKEQQGAGAEYRMTTLQKYADYVQGNWDFPLDQFRSRHNPATEAIGYGKSLMFFHMLRRELGDGSFVKGLREFYLQYRFRYASFDDLRRTFEATSGKDLQQEFREWVTRTGAPQLAVSKPLVSNGAGGAVLQVRLEQKQPGEAYRLRVPLAVTIEGREQTVQTVVEMNNKELTVDLPLSGTPLRLDIDPEYDLFRRVDRDELPPALSQALGAKRMLVVLPSGAVEDLLQAYREFAAALKQAGPDEVDVKLDSDLKTLPADRSVMLLGWENRFAVDLFEALFNYDVSVKDRSVRISGDLVPVKAHSFVLTSRFPRNHSMALSFIASDGPAPLPGLARKLPHYHKYSYLAFEGNEPENVVKGRWPVLDSPLTVFMPGKSGFLKKTGMAKLAPREPLTTLEPVSAREPAVGTIHP